MDLDSTTEHTMPITAQLGLTIVTIREGEKISLAACVATDDLPHRLARMATNVSDSMRQLEEVLARQAYEGTHPVGLEDPRTTTDFAARYDYVENVLNT